MTIKTRCSTSKRPDCLYFILHRFIEYCVSCMRNKQRIVRVRFYNYLRDQKLFTVGKAPTWMDKLYYRHEEFIIKTTDAVYAGLLGPVEFEQAIKEYIRIYLGVDMDEINKAQAVTVIDNSDFNSYMIKKPKNRLPVITTATSESSGSDGYIACCDSKSAPLGTNKSTADASLEISIGSFDFRIKNKDGASLFCDVVTMMRTGGLLK